MEQEYAGHAPSAAGSVGAGRSPTEEDTVSYWFCLTHSSVEPDEGCAHAERLGPYPDRATAEQALERARKRSEAWDHDVRWNDEDLDD
jgi:hypothetical protein